MKIFGDSINIVVILILNEITPETLFYWFQPVKIVITVNHRHQTQLSMSRST
jgi:hypothetical protein